MASITGYYIFHDANGSGVNHIYEVTELLKGNEYMRKNIPICNHRENCLHRRTGENYMHETEVIQKIIDILNLENRDRIICGECMEQIFLERQSTFDDYADLLDSF